MARSDPENDLRNACLEYLHSVRHIAAWRNNTGAAKYKGPDGAIRFVRFSVPGASDIFGVLKPYGVFLAVETKIRPKKPTVAQIAFLTMIETAGGVGVVAYSLDDLQEAIDDFYAARQNGLTSAAERLTI